MGGGNEGTGIDKSSSLAAKEPQSHEQMKRLKAFFDKNLEKIKEQKGAGHTIKTCPYMLAWGLHGGDAAMNWVNQELDSKHDDNLRTKTNMRKAGGAGKNKGMGVFDISMTDPTKQRIHK